MHTEILSDPTEEARLLVRVSTLANRFALRVLPPDDAEDLAQRVVLDCLVRLRIGRWRVHTSLRALVRDMVRRKFLWGLRGSTARAARDAQHLEERTECAPMWMDPSAALEMREAETLRAQAMSELPARCRAAYRLVRVKKMTHCAVAAHLGVSLRLVAYYVKNAERHLASRVLDDVAPPRSQLSMGRRPRRGRRPVRGEAQRRRVGRRPRAGPIASGEGTTVKSARARRMSAERSVVRTGTTAIVDETTPTFERSSSISG